MYTLKPSEKIVKLLCDGRNYKIPKGQIIQSTEDRRVFNYLKSGFVKRYLISNDGSYGVQVIYGPEDMFPITLAFSAVFDRDINDSPETYYYEAMTDVELFTVDEESLKDAIGQDPILYKDLFGICGARLHSTLHGLENLTLSNSYHRVAHEILFLAKKYGTKRAAGTEIQVALTHQDLADILSLTRETVSTAMVQLRKNKLIVTNKHILVPDLAKLEAEAHD